ncbi:MAG: transglycosylase SLT domain-containing protein [Flavobacteriales bacterium]|nr:transglycosylase SLT domain-containing protein [Flavobacteriales bacterium]
MKTVSCLLLPFMCFLSALSSQAQIVKDSTLGDGRRAMLRIEVVPCDSDTAQIDTISLGMVDCTDTLCTWIPYRTVFDLADSLAIVFKVPPKLVYEIGMNESRWPRPYELNYLIKMGDLQIIDATFSHFYKELKLQGGKTRENYLIVGIYYLSWIYKQYHSWEKTRYVYGRGRWKDPSQWTALERKFMGKIDWSQYDNVRAGANSD